MITWVACSLGYFIFVILLVCLTAHFVIFIFFHKIWLYYWKTIIYFLVLLFTNLNVYFLLAYGVSQYLENQSQTALTIYQYYLIAALLINLSFVFKIFINLLTQISHSSSDDFTLENQIQKSAKQTEKQEEQKITDIPKFLFKFSPTYFRKTQEEIQQQHHQNEKKNCNETKKNNFKLKGQTLKSNFFSVEYRYH
eukprot:TRINITY_DN10887_c0_g1_i4.p1 TRINITY_DN10887_c0_g1~~TRINITY_DN10887_c0_g1_i4.p1  ORF type:complete len:195 (+),score=27.80 TRINITY_DN10887_c0_g1_i4:322-906(+)